MTEDQAKQKWCPFSRVSAQSGTGRHTGPAPSPASNRIALPDENRHGTPLGSMCIGSACMAWRWGGPVAYAQSDTFTVSAPPDPSGYCGLAGRPS